jgi:hypothetical protein
MFPSCFLADIMYHVMHHTSLAPAGYQLTSCVPVLIPCPLPVGPGLLCAPFNPGCKRNCLGRVMCEGGPDCWTSHPDPQPSKAECDITLQGSLCIAKDGKGKKFDVCPGAWGLLSTLDCGVHDQAAQPGCLPAALLSVMMCARLVEDLVSGVFKCIRMYVARARWFPVARVNVEMDAQCCIHVTPESGGHRHGSVCMPSHHLYESLTGCCSRAAVQSSARAPLHLSATPQPQPQLSASLR